MSDRPWKAFERQISALFGTTRALMKGTGTVKDIGPEDDFPLLLDCKLRLYRDWRVMSWFMKLEKAAEKEQYAKWAVLCLREPKKSVRYAIVKQGPLMKFIVHKTKNLPAEKFLIHDGGIQSKTSIVVQWNYLRKRMIAMKKFKGNRQLPHDTIPMLRLYDKRYGRDLVVLRPEDLARIFFDGGLLKKENKS